MTPACTQEARYLVDNAWIVHMKLINLAQPLPLNNQNPIKEIEDNVMGLSIQIKSSAESSKERPMWARKVFHV